MSWELRETPTNGQLSDWLEAVMDIHWEVRPPPELEELHRREIGVIEGAVACVPRPSAKMPVQWNALVHVDQGMAGDLQAWGHVGHLVLLQRVVGTDSGAPAERCLFWWWSAGRLGLPYGAEVQPAEALNRLRSARAAQVARRGRSRTRRPNAAHRDPHRTGSPALM